MKRYKFFIATILLAGIIHLPGWSQGAKQELSLNLSYFNKNDKLQLLQASAKTKVNGKFQPVSGIHLQFYITDEQESNSLGKSITDEKGMAAIYIPPSAKEEWVKSETREFLVTSESTANYDSTKVTAEVTKSKIRIDTGADKKIIATFLALKKGKWVPVSGIDLVLAVKRLNGDLLVDQTPTHTTDSVGEASADYSINELAGDTAGNIILVAKVQDNDLYGNLSAEKPVPWGIPARYTSEFGKRSLFAGRRHSPYWLVFMAYTIGLSVWGVIIYLIFQIAKIKKLGRATT